MAQMGFEIIIPVFERAKTVHALDRAATVIGKFRELFYEISNLTYLRSKYLHDIFNIRTV
jgi:hypothetical protein